MLEAQQMDISEESTRDIMARESLMDFNRIIAEHPDIFPVRKHGFESEIIMDSKDVQFTYNPREGEEEEGEQDDDSK